MNKRSTKPIAVIMIIVTIVLFFVLGGIYLYLKNDKSVKGDANNTSGSSNNYTTLLKQDISNMYGYSFYFEVSGERSNEIFPKWFDTLFYQRIVKDIQDDDDTIYIYGTTGKGYVDMRISFASPSGRSQGDIMLSSEDVEKYETLVLKGNDDGLFMINVYNIFEGMKYCVYPIEYLSGNSVDYCKYIKFSTNGTGISLTNEWLSMLDDMNSDDNIKSGITESGDYAFSVMNDYVYTMNGTQDWNILLPTNFSMSYSKNSDGVLEFVGAGGGLEIKGWIKESSFYASPYELNSSWEVVEPSYFVDILLNNESYEGPVYSRIEE